MANDGSVIIDILADDKQFKSALSGLGNAAKAGMAAVAAAIAVAGTALVAFGADAVKVGSNFEAAMSEVAAISGATGGDIDALTQKAKDMGATTKFSASEAAEGLKYMAMAGWDTEDMLNGLSGIMDLAAASGEELGSVSDIVTDALTAFGLQASDSAHFADVLAMASSKSNTNVGLMGATFKYVAPIAGSLGYSIEDTAVAIGLMANAGIKGEQAGTALRATLTRMVKPPKAAGKALQALGIDITTLDGAMRPLGEVLVDLRAKFAGLDDSQKASMASSLAGQEAMSGLLAIVNASESDFKKLTKEINNANGAADKMAAIMQDNLKGRMEELGGGIETIKIQIYEGLEKSLKTAAETGIKSVDRLSKSLKNGALKGAVDKIGQSIETLSKKIGEAAEKWIPKLAEGFAWLVENGGKLVGVVASVYAGFKIMQIVESAAGWFSAAALQVNLFTAANGVAALSQAALKGELMLSEIVVGVFTGKIGLLTAAQSALNAVTAAHPFGILALAIGAVVVAIGTLLAASSKAESEAKKHREAMEEAAEKAHALAEASKELSDSAKEARNSIKSEAIQAQGLANRLYTLAKAEGKTTAQKEELAGIVDELNSLYPELNLLYDEEKNSLDKNAEAVGALIKAKEQEAYLASHKEESIALRKEEASITAELAVAEANAKEKKDMLTEAELAYKTALAGPERARALEELHQMQAAEEAARATLSELDGQQRMNTETLKANEQQINSLSQSMAESGAEQTKAAETFEQTLQRMGMARWEFDEGQKYLADQAKETAQTIQDAYGAIEEAVTNAFDRIDGKAKGLSFDEMKANFDHNQEVTREWSENLALLAEAGIDEGILKTLNEAGPEGAAQVKKLADELRKESGGVEDALVSLDEGVQKKVAALNESFRNGMAMVPETLVTAFSGTEAEGAATAFVESMESAFENAMKVANFPEQGASVPSGIAGGVEGNAQVGIDATEDFGAKIGEAGRDSLKTNSPSKVFIEIAEGIPEGVAVGIKNKTPDALAAIKRMVEEVRAEATRSVIASNFASVGRSIADGIAQGIRDGKSGVVSAAVSAIREAAAAAKSAAQINSPSKLFAREIGGPMAEGIAVGFSKETSAIIREMENAVAWQHAKLAEDLQTKSEAPGGATAPPPPVVFDIDVHTGPINDDLDVMAVSREIGTEAARQIRQRGGLTFA